MASQEVTSAAAVEKAEVAQINFVPDIKEKDDDALSINEAALGNK